MKWMSGRGILLAVVVVCTVTACGGSKKNTVTPTKIETTTPIRGKVIDGYVRGATVWLDVNGNKQLDAGEPQTQSKAGGDYLLELTKEQLQCASYVTVYVDVPVGAIDEDSGPVTQAYQMSRPPHLLPLSKDDVLNISPLTSVLNDLVLKKLESSGQPGSGCAALLANEQVRQMVKQELQQLISDFVSKHNIAADKIFADFIQNNDKASYLLAQSIVKGLKASYQYRDVLKAKYPNATYIRTLYFQGRSMDVSSGNAWYRDVAVWLPAGFVFEQYKVSDDLSKELRLIYQRESQKKAWGEGSYEFSHDKYSYGGDGSLYQCSSSESVRLSRDGVSYVLSNSAATASVKDPAQCARADFSSTDQRYYYFYTAQGRVSYDTRMSLRPSNSEFSYFKDWFNLEYKAASLDVNALVKHLAAAGYQFDQPVLLDVDSWYKRRTDDSTSNRVITFKDHTGAWVRETTQSNQTVVKECSRDGLVWSACQ